MAEWYYHIGIIGGFIFFVLFAFCVMIMVLTVVLRSIQRRKDRRMTKEIKTLIEEYSNEN